MALSRSHKLLPVVNASQLECLLVYFWPDSWIENLMIATVSRECFFVVVVCAAWIDRSHVKVFTQVVPLFSIVMRGEFSRISVKKTGAEVFSDA